jgi:hypothetical protein
MEVALLSGPRWHQAACCHARAHTRALIKNGALQGVEAAHRQQQQHAAARQAQAAQAIAAAAALHAPPAPAAVSSLPTHFAPSTLTIPSMVPASTPNPSAGVACTPVAGLQVPVLVPSPPSAKVQEGMLGAGLPGHGSASSGGNPPAPDSIEVPPAAALEPPPSSSPSPAAGAPVPPPAAAAVLDSGMTGCWEGDGMQAADAGQDQQQATPILPTTRTVAGGDVIGCQGVRNKAIPGHQDSVTAAGPQPEDGGLAAPAAAFRHTAPELATCTADEAGTRQDGLGGLGVAGSSSNTVASETEGRSESRPQPTAQDRPQPTAQDRPQPTAQDNHEFASAAGVCADAAIAVAAAADGGDAGRCNGEESMASGAPAGLRAYVQATAGGDLAAAGSGEGGANGPIQGESSGAATVAAGDGPAAAVRCKVAAGAAAALSGAGSTTQPASSHSGGDSAKCEQLHEGNCAATSDKSAVAVVGAPEAAGQGVGSSSHDDGPLMHSQSGTGGGLPSGGVGLEAAIVGDRSKDRAVATAELGLVTGQASDGTASELPAELHAELSEAADDGAVDRPTPLLASEPGAKSAVDSLLDDLLGDDA